MISFFKGIIISIVLGVPAGPVGVMTIQNTLKNGFKSGLTTGMGSAVADIFFASVGAFGVHIISDYFVAHQDIISIVGGILLLFLGIRSILKKPEALQTEDKNALCSKENVIGFSSALVISITNPATILAFLFAFTIFDVAENLNVFEAIMLVLGVLSGAIFWWVTLSAVTAKFKDKIKTKTNKLLNIICGIIMFILAVVMFVKAII